MTPAVTKTAEYRPKITTNYKDEIELCPYVLQRLYKEPLLLHSSRFLDQAVL